MDPGCFDDAGRGELNESCRDVTLQAKDGGRMCEEEVSPLNLAAFHLGRSLLCLGPASASLPTQRDTSTLPLHSYKLMSLRYPSLRPAYDHNIHRRIDTDIY